MADVRFCDDAGMVSYERHPRFDGSYLDFCNHLRLLSDPERAVVSKPFPCSGSMTSHALGGNTPCSSPAHRLTRYFTFGFGHAHAVNGFTYDKDIVVKVTARDPRAVMQQWFGNGWSMEYESEEAVDMSFYPRGIKELAVPDGS